MYTRTAQSTHYLKRTGSYSTVPHANGRVDVLPPGASEPIFGDLRERRAALVDKVHEAEKNLGELRNEGLALRPIYNRWSRAVRFAKDRGLRPPVVPAQITRHEQRFKEAKLEHGRVLNELRNLNKVVDLREIKNQEWHQLFVLVAEQLLDERAFSKIKSEVVRRFEMSKQKDGCSTPVR